MEYKLVPAVPTQEMIDAWRIDQSQGRSLQSSYMAMLAAAPSHEDTITVPRWLFGLIVEKSSPEVRAWNLTAAP